MTLDAALIVFWVMVTLITPVFIFLVVACVLHALVDSK
jgi:hypothetical protein